MEAVDDGACSKTSVTTTAEHALSNVQLWSNVYGKWLVAGVWAHIVADGSHGCCFACNPTAQGAVS